MNVPPPNFTERGRPGLLVVAAIAWTVLVLGVTAAVWRYKSEPGERSPAPRHWPTDSRLSRSDVRITLVVFLHPKCPCTSATLAELRRLTADTAKVAAVAVFVAPEGSGDGFLEGRNLDAAAGIPGVALCEDIGGVEAARFGARTSGHAVAYSADGELLFEGGLTTARGHVGESAAATSAILGSNTPREPGSAPVFGCSLGAPR